MTTTEAPATRPTEVPGLPEAGWPADEGSSQPPQVRVGELVPVAVDEPLDAEPAPIPRAAFWQAAGVVGGWYVAAAFAVLVWIGSLDPSPPLECGMWLCLSPQQGAMLALLVAGPLLVAVGLVMSVAAVPPAYRRTGSWLVAGNLAAALGLLAVAGVVAVAVFGAQR